MIIILGTKELFFFHILSFYHKYSLYIWWNVHLVPKFLQEKWIRVKRENEMMVRLDLKTDSCYAMHSCYGVNCVHPWLPVWWYWEVGSLGGTQVDMGFWWWSLMMGLASPSFSLLFSVFFLPFNHHMWEHSKKRKTDGSQEWLHWELSWPPPWSCIVSSLWQPVGLRG